MFAASKTSAPVNGVTSDPKFNYVTMLLHGDGTNGAQNNTFLDSSTNNYTITSVGSTAQGSYSPYGSNWSNYFNGSNWLTVANSAGLAFGSGDFTIEVWVYISSTSGTIINYSNGQSSTSNFAWELYHTGTSTMQFSVFQGTSQYLSSSTAFTLNTWNHIACVRSGTSLKTYVNGVAGATVGNLTGVTISDPAGSTVKLCSYGNGSYYATGYLSNLRVVKGTALYTSNFTPSKVPLTAISGTTLLTCQSKSFIDNSNSALTVTPTASPSVERFSPFSPVLQTPTSYSTFFGSANGNCFYLTATASGTGGVALTGNYTIEMWLYPTAASSSGYSMLVATNSNGGVVQLYYNSAGNLGYYSPVAGQLTTNSAPLTFNAWQHVAFVRSSNVVKVYVNGVEKPFTSTITDSSTVYANYIGGLDTIYNTLGYMSNLRVVSGTALYTSNFTPPTAPLTAISGTQLLTCQSSTLIDNSTNAYPLTVSGSTTTRSQNPFGVMTTSTDATTGLPYTTAIYGGSVRSDSTVTLYSNTASPISGSTSNWTMEAWCYFNTISGYSFVMGLGNNTGGSTPYLDLNITSTSITIEESSTVSTIWSATGSTTFVTGQWYHLAATRTGNTIRVFSNGVQIASTTYTGAIQTGLKPFAVGLLFGGGTARTDGVNGFVSDARFISGTSLYTSNFVPPVTPLQAVTNTALLLNMTNAGIYDNAMMNDLQTNGNAQISTSVVKYGTGSIYFDGTGDYLYTPKSIQSKFTGNFTIEFWVYFNTVAGTQDLIGNYVSNVSTDWIIIMSGTGIQFYPSGSSSYVYSGASSVTTNTWYHVAAVRSGSTCSLYVNGVSVGSPLTVSTAIGDSTKPVYIGARSGPSSYFNGYIDDLRITNGDARYTANFTPPTTAFPNTGPI